MLLLLRWLRSCLRIGARQPGEVLPKAVARDVAMKGSLRAEVGVEGVPAAHVLARRGQGRLLTKGLQQAVLAEGEKECVVAIELLAQGAVEQAHLLVRDGRKLCLPD